MYTNWKIKQNASGRCECVYVCEVRVLCSNKQQLQHQRQQQLHSQTTKIIFKLQRLGACVYGNWCFHFISLSLSSCSVSVIIYLFVLSSVSNRERIFFHTILHFLFFFCKKFLMIPLWWCMRFNKSMQHKCSSKNIVVENHCG